MLCRMKDYSYSFYGVSHNWVNTLCGIAGRNLDMELSKLSTLPLGGGLPWCGAR